MMCYVHISTKQTNWFKKQTNQKTTNYLYLKKNTSDVVLSDNTKRSIRKQSKEFLPGKKMWLNGKTIKKTLQ